MKRIILYLTLVLLSVQMFSTPEEAKNSRYYISRRLNDTIYVGNREYKSIIGGIYEKGNTCGMVFYVDEDKKTMLILCVTTRKIISEDEEPTYALIKERYQKYGWNLLNERVCNLLIANTPTIIYNRDWKDGEKYNFPRTDCIIMESSDNSTLVNTYMTSSPKHPYHKMWKYITNVNGDGTSEIEYFTFTHTGWKEVPFETEYVAHYIR